LARCAWVKNSWFANLAGRCREVSASSVQIPWRSGSPQGVNAWIGVVGALEAIWAQADVGKTGAEMTTAAADAVTTTITTEAEKRLSTMVLLSLEKIGLTRQNTRRDSR
jgi:hypothetical protein